jgi:osmotically-inducible protein OsmY
MTKTFNLTLAAGFLTAATLMTPVAFAQTAFPGGDQAETNAVQSAIDQDAGLRAAQVRVQTIDGVVYLHGRVGSQGAVDRAENIARGVGNVGEVVNTVSDSEFQG